MWSAVLENAASDLHSELVQRINAVSLPGRMNQPGHPPDNGRSFVLNDDFATNVPNVLRSDHAIGSHAGHDYTEHIGPACARHGTEEHIYCGTTKVLRRILIEIVAIGTSTGGPNAL